MGSIYTADFETTVREDDCRVWAWAMCDIERPEQCETGIDIESFIERVRQDTSTVYFHNLKFDGGFIIDWLFRHGYAHMIRKKTEKGKLEKVLPGCMSSVISDMGQWYSLTVCFPETGTTVTFKDSLKLIPLSVEKIPGAYGLPNAKLAIDYREDRPKGHRLTREEEEYVKEDVIIVAKAIKIMIEQGQTKMTAASNALEDFKTRFGKDRFPKYFPELPIIEYSDDKRVDVDKEVRMSYKGGWSYLNPEYADKPVQTGRVYDINSMYPWAMHDCILPFGMPIGYKGKPEPRSDYPLYTIQIICPFKLAAGKWPSIQLKNVWGFSDTEYVKEAEVPVLLTLTDVDYKLFRDMYDVPEDEIEYIGGYYFHGAVGMISEYIDYWYHVKEESDRTGNKGMKQIAKLMLNSLYGKFGARRDGRSKIPYFDKQEDKVKYSLGDEEEREGVYIPVATWITSYCRDKIIRAAVGCRDRFIYADTDSLHVLGDYPVPGLDVDQYRLGAFKHESSFVRARFIRSKTYMEIERSRKFVDYDGYEDTEEEINLKCAGMPSRMKATVQEPDFYMGAKFPVGPGSRFAPKLVPKTVPGGVILREMPFEIR